MKYYLIFALLFSSFLYSQDIEKLKKLDTIYVLFKKNKIPQILKIDNEKTAYCSNKNVCFFIKKDTLNNYINIIKNKKFLKNHKKEIISADFFILKNRRKIDEINKTPKVYFIIDETNFDKKNIVLTAAENPRIVYF